MSNDLDSDEMSLLDMLVTMAESWRLLVFGPLAAGLIGLGVAFGLPSTYHSEAKLVLASEQLFTVDVAIIVAESDDYLLAVAQKTDLVGSAQDAQVLASMRQRLTTRVDRKRRLLELRAAGPTPEKARVLAELAVTELLSRSVPSGAQRQQIEREMANARQSIEGYQAARVAVSRLLAGPLPSNFEQVFIAGLVSLQVNNEATENRVARLQAQLRGVGQESVIRKPSYPRERSSPKRSQVAVGTALATGFVLILWVFARQAWRKVVNQPGTADKFTALRAALSVRRTRRSS